MARRRDASRGNRRAARCTASSETTSASWLVLTAATIKPVAAKSRSDSAAGARLNVFLIQRRPDYFAITADALSGYRLHDTADKLLRHLGKRAGSSPICPSPHVTRLRLAFGGAVGMPCGAAEGRRQQIVGVAESPPRPCRCCGGNRRVLVVRSTCNLRHEADGRRQRRRSRTSPGRRRRWSDST